MEWGEAALVVATLAAAGIVGLNIGTAIETWMRPRTVLEDHWQVYRIWFWQAGRYLREGFSVSREYSTGTALLWLTLPGQILGEWARPTATRIVGEGA